MEKVVEEIDRRIKRLQAEMEIAQASLERLEELETRAKGTEIRDYSPYYLAGTLLWLAIGLVLLMALSRRVSLGFTIPTGLYIIVLMAFGIPLAYHLLTRGREEEPEKDLRRREMLAGLLIREFYKPLREAVEGNETHSIEALAERLLDDSRLAQAMTELNEGDPKLVAYALLLYSKFTPELRGEVEETLRHLGNKPARALLESLLRKGYNGEERSVEGEGDEV